MPATSVEEERMIRRADQYKVTANAASRRAFDNTAPPLGMSLGSVVQAIGIIRYIVLDAIAAKGTSRTTIESYSDPRTQYSDNPTYYDVSRGLLTTGFDGKSWPRSIPTNSNVSRDLLTNGFDGKAWPRQPTNTAADGTNKRLLTAGPNIIPRSRYSSTASTDTKAKGSAPSRSQDIATYSSSTNPKSAETQLPAADVSPAIPSIEKQCAALSKLVENLTDTATSRQRFPNPLPLYKSGRQLCERLKLSLDLVTSRHIYSCPSAIHRRARGMYDDYDKRIAAERKRVLGVRKTFDEIIAEYNSLRMNQAVYRQLLEMALDVQELAMRSEEIYMALARAKDKKLEYDIRHQELVRLRVENVTAVVNAVAAFAPDVHLM
ncbi:uncharacterized protein AB675_1579 [Cyphellophora attinorum]|uniref:Uncharacterized protein n=1 Tax=Cyphellophora attinorum TaxID=1664694 RepID=A0A0N1H088_9EURO|nr:uncharacterized protein AB675_1579 [Phialophora attinorum]KPI37193.1 hypothetical protein AB675_1579 [Phialophora attinorum]